jgi:small conductance mechanosensitive channel
MIGAVDVGTVVAQTALQELLNDYIPAEFTGAVASFLKFLAAFLAVYLLGKTFVTPVAGRMMERRGLERHARVPIRKLISILVVFVAVSVAFGFAGYGSFLTSLATIAAAATLAIGFAMQNVISNFVAGVFIFTEQPFKIGDWIEFDGQNGVVEDISLRVTRVRTFDNELLTVPNSQLTDNVIKNPVAMGQLRLQFLFGISYDDDIDPAADIIVEEAKAHSGIMDDPAPTVRLTELGDSYVGLKSRIWIDDPSRADFVRIRSEYVQAVKEEFDEAGIDIPFPNRTLGGEIQLADAETALADD